MYASARLLAASVQFVGARIALPVCPDAEAAVAFARLMSSMSAPANLVLLNANVLTMDQAQPRAQAVAMGGGRILGVGSNDDMRAWINGSAVVRDLGGHTLLPGFFDSHNHMLLTGMDLLAVDLSSARTIADVLQAIERRAASTPAGQWVVSSARWHESQLVEQRFPRREELDRVSAGHPVVLTRGGHNVVGNSLALEAAGIGPDVSNPPGGTFVRDSDGALNGHAIGAAAQLLRGRMPAPPEHALHEALLRIERAYNAAGITSVIDPGLNAAQIAAYKSLARGAAPTVRASLMWRLNPGFDDQSLQSALSQLRSGEVQRELEDNWTRVLAIKLGVDGGVEAGFYREPYVFADDPSSPRGKPAMSQANFEAFCCEAARLEWQVGAHCVGDAAIDAALEAFEAADRVAPIAGRRWTLIHMMLAREDHWSRANRLGLIVTAQQPLVYTLAEGFLKYIGPERTRDLEPLGMYLSRAELPVGGGSDSPVTPYQPLLGIWSSVTRQTHGGGVQGSDWQITPEQALKMYTIGSAFSAIEEHLKGSITRGKFADLVVLDADPCRVEPEAIRDIRVLLTLVNGEVVFEA
jgi:predicted amidohydrolase YtcJ